MSTYNKAHLTESITIDPSTDIKIAALTGYSTTIWSKETTGGAGTDTILNIENLAGSSYNDHFVGNAVANTMWGGAGNDVIEAQAGNDVVYAESGDDLIMEQGGNDTIFGGDGNDTINAGYANGDARSVDEATGNDYVDGGNGIDTLYVDGARSGVTVDLNITTAQNTGGAGTDTILNIENLAGSSFNDHFVGNAVANTIWGGAGGDVVEGKGGNDVIYAESGDDFIYGGLGNDTLSGGTGNDSFVFETTLSASNIDTITDFVVGQDLFKLDDAVFAKLTSMIGGALNSANFALSSAKDANDYIVYNQSNGYVYYDADGNGAGAAVQFADITDNLTNFNSSCFMIV